VLDAQLDRDAHAVCNVRNVGKILFVERAVLGIDSEEVVIANGHRVFDVVF